MERDQLFHKISQSGTIVIKIGSSRVSGKQSAINDFVMNLAWDVRKLRDMGKKVILVSSGAVAQGKMLAQEQALPRQTATSLPMRQAYAAMGQSRLMNLYESFFSKNNIPIAQILFGILDIQEKSGFQNLKNTFEQLLQWNILPIVNENDSISTEELKFGDNDILSALVASLTRADLLLLLTGTDGFYKNKKRISFLESITPADFKAAKGPVGPGTGGMRSKLQAADVLLQHGIMTGILHGEKPGVIGRFFQGEDVGTLVAGDKKRIYMEENEIKKIFNEKFFKNL